jgi:hypothetical protein
MSTGGVAEAASAAAIAGGIAVAITPANNSDVRKFRLLRILQNYATGQHISMPLT